MASRPLATKVFLAAGLVLTPVLLRAAATITILNADPPGIGFNDPTPAAPVGGNTGTTLGQQRLNVFQAAAAKWGATLSSSVTIRVHAIWVALTCTSTSAILGSAGATEVWRDFTNAPVANHWYGKAQANALSGTDQDSTAADIDARFNINLGNSGCLNGIHFYLGLDNNYGSNIDLVTVLTHEFAHGLGFQTFTNGQTGAPLVGFPSIWDDFLLDNTTNKTWTLMTNNERAVSAINTGHLVWNGGNVTSAIPQVLQPQGSSFKGADPTGRALLYAPGTYQLGSSVSHWDPSMFPNQLMEPVLAPNLTHEVSPPQDLTLPLLKDIGWPTSAPTGGSNLAAGRLATQSSTLSGYATAGPAAAVDGNTDGNFFHGSVTHTDLEANAWWQVDLGSSATINSVTLWNRTDCCSSRLSDYWVFVSDTPFGPADTPATLQNRPGTFSSHQIASPSPSLTIAAGGTHGRFVRVQLSGTNYLSLAEVQVIGTGSLTAANIALGKSATQSSTLPGYTTAGPTGAVDGITDGNFFHGSVTHTNLESNAWWQVDLGASATVNSITIWNRIDCCSSRLSDYWVFVSDTPFAPTDTPATLQNRPGTWSNHQTTAPNPSTTIMAGTQGRYVRVQLSGTNYLSLAEVQVLGTGAPVASNFALGKTAAQSSTLPGYATTGPAGAVDGSTDGNFFDGSVTHTNLDSNAWWQVDLGASAEVNSIVIWNRTDACCVNRLNDYWVFVSDTPFSPSDTPATLQNRPGTFSSHQTTAPNPSVAITVSAQGRYVRVQLSGANYLSLAEVQVFGLQVF